MFPLVFLSSNWLGIVCKGPRISNKPIFIARFNVDELYLFNDLTKDIFNTLLVTIQYETYKVIIMLVKGFFSILHTAESAAATTAAASSPLSTLLETSLIGKLSWTSRSHSTHHVTEHNNSHMIV